MKESPTPQPTPLYITIPSVRPTIMATLCKWFTHAVEARAEKGTADVLRKINGAIEHERNQKVKAQLRKIRNAVRQRLGAFHGTYEHPIHLVVADNSAFHPDASKTTGHTAAALQLSRALNRIGNRMGIYIHYIGPNSMKQWLPNPVPPKHPYAHLHEGVLRISPGGALNIALSYLLGWHESHHEEPNVRIFKIDDDISPGQGKVTWHNEPKQYRNFFLDQRSLENKLFEENGGYRGYNYKSRKRTQGHQIASDDEGPIMEMAEAPLKTLHYANTSFAETIGTSYSRLPYPNYLIHSGNTRTYPSNRAGAFGQYVKRHRSPVQKADEKNLRRVKRESGIQAQNQHPHSEG